MKREGEKEYLTAREAAKYLAERWGFQSYSVIAFRVYRNRLGIEPDLSAENASLWRRETLDKIPKPRPKGRPRGTTQQHEKDDTESVA